MKTVILPGYSAHNKEWAHEVKEKLQLDHEVIVQEWRHWPPAQKASGSVSHLSQGFSLKYEVEEILKKVGKNRINIIAKSVGTMVLMHLTPKISRQINKTILCGIPTKFQSGASKKLYSEGLSLLSPSRFVIFQNEKDPLANYSVVKKFIHSINPEIKMIEKPRSDHTYPYFEDFQKFLSKA